MNERITSLKTCKACGVAKPATSEFFATRDTNSKEPFYPTCRQCQPPATTRPEIGRKTCRQCGEAKPKTPEFFRTNGRPGSFKPVCKKCLNDPPKPQAPAGMKFCIECKEAKPATLDFFHRDKRKEGLRNSCKTCSHKATVRNQQKNPERTRAMRLARYWRNPVKFRLKSTLRNRKLKDSGTVTPADVQAKLNQQNKKCYWCRKKLIGQDFHIDHIIPISKGGPHTPANICCACAHCNLSKNNKLPHEWIGRLF